MAIKYDDTAFSNELKLGIAIQQHGEYPVGDLSDEEKHEYATGVAMIFCVLHRDARCEFSESEIVRRGIMMRDIVAMHVAEQHGVQCFWKCRGKGPCCNNAELGRIVPGGKYTVENCVIECRSHNHQRRAMTVEEYLQSDLKTS